MNNNQQRIIATKKMPDRDNLAFNFITEIIGIKISFKKTYL